MGWNGEECNVSHWNGVEWIGLEKIEWTRVE